MSSKNSMAPSTERGGKVADHGGICPAAVPVVAIEAETGLSKEVIRKWEVRYGFPSPDRDENGDRLYPAEQVLQIQLIRRLLGAGMRPSKVVGLDLESLERLAADVSPAKEAHPSGFSLQVLDTLVAHDLGHLNHLLRGQKNRQGLSLFVRDTLARLNTVVGDAWLRGDIQVFEEHLYTEAVIDVLHEAVRTVTASSGFPRVLLSTAPGELHTIGLLMASAVLTLEGACCIRLGPQTPQTEIVAAVKACRIDAVGLSFSIAHPVRDSANFLRDLRRRLDPGVHIWAGGRGVARLRRIPGVRFIGDLDEIGPAIRALTAGKA